MPVPLTRIVLGRIFERAADRGSGTKIGSTGTMKGAIEDDDQRPNSSSLDPSGGPLGISAGDGWGHRRGRLEIAERNRGFGLSSALSRVLKN
jgi:hypothetical protein